MEYLCFNQRGDTSTLNGSSLKLVDKFTFLGSSVSSTETYINMRLGKAWTAINRLSVIWKLDLTDKIKHIFPNSCRVNATTWTLTKRMENKFVGNNTRMLRATLKNPGGSSQQRSSYHPPRKLSKLDEPDMRELLEKYGRAHK